MRLPLSQNKKSILQMAVQVKLVPQDPTDEPASVLLERIRPEKERLIKEDKIKRDVIYKGGFHPRKLHHESYMPDSVEQSGKIAENASDNLELASSKTEKMRLNQFVIYKFRITNIFQQMFSFI